MLSSPTTFLPRTTEQYLLYHDTLEWLCTMYTALVAIRISNLWRLLLRDLDLLVLEGKHNCLFCAIIIFWWLMPHSLIPSSVFALSWMNKTRPENCGLLGSYAASSSNILQTFRDNISVPSTGFKNRFLNPGDGTYRLSRNVGMKLLLFTA